MNISHIRNYSVLDCVKNLNLTESDQSIIPLIVKHHVLFGLLSTGEFSFNKIRIFLSPKLRYDDKAKILYVEEIQPDERHSGNINFEENLYVLIEIHQFEDLAV